MPDQRELAKQFAKDIEDIWKLTEIARDGCSANLPNGAYRFPKSLHPVRDELACAFECQRQLYEKYSGRHGKEYQSRGMTGQMCRHVNQARKIIASVIKEMPEVADRFHTVFVKLRDLNLLAQRIRNEYDGRQA